MPNDEVAAPTPSEPRRPTGRYEAGRDYIPVARGSDLVVIRVVGTGNMLVAPGLAEFAEEQRKTGFRRYVFDLERCRGLDSTFMGVMVGMCTALRTESGQHARVEDAVPEPAAPVPAADEELHPISPADALSELQAKFAERRGADAPPPAVPAPAPPPRSGHPAEGAISAVNVAGELRTLMSMLGVDKFVKVRGSCDLTQLETTILPEKTVAPDERRRLIIKAHETLVEIDKRNEAQFGAFLKSLSAELAQD